MCAYYGLAPLLVTLNDLEGLLLFEAFLIFILREMYNVLSAICLHLNWKALKALQFQLSFQK